MVTAAKLHQGAPSRKHAKHGDTGRATNREPWDITQQLLDEMRRQGWTVAVHNDCRLNGKSFTFYLFTHSSGVWTKGEGRTDLEAISNAMARAPAPMPFQYRVAPWMRECFGRKISANRIERNHRFLEEALELVQANGCTREDAHQLVDYVYGRPVGDLHQEIGGVMVTLAALCLASGADMHQAGENELARVWTKVEQIRAKQAAKPKHSPLPA